MWVEMEGDFMDFQTAESQYRYYSEQCSQGKITYQQFLDAVNKIPKKKTK